MNCHAAAPSEARDLAKQLRKALKQFTIGTNYGIEMIKEGESKGTPVHCNSRTHPLPWTRTGKSGHLFRIASAVNDNMVASNLTGSRALFWKSRSDRLLTLHAADFDADRPATSVESEQVARAAFAALHPGLALFFEMSRGGRGCYAWVKVRWTTRDPHIRNALLNAWKRSIRPHAQHPHIKLDSVKGTVTFSTPNLRYDHRFANELSESGKYIQVTLTSEGWVETEIARQMPGWKRTDPEKERWVRISNLEAYDRYKAFYGIVGNKVDKAVRFVHDTRLEPTATRQGVLVTYPCFSALSGTRPNNVKEFMAWLDSPAGVITEKQLRAALLPADLQRIDGAVLRKVGGRPVAHPRQVPAPQPAVAPPAPPVPPEPIQVDLGAVEASRQEVIATYGQGRKVLRFLNQAGDPFDRSRDAAHMVIRRLGPATSPAQIEAEVLRLVELPCGPAQRAHHPDRDTKVRDLVAWCLAHPMRRSMPTAAGREDAPRFTPADVAHIEKWLEGQPIDRAALAAALSKGGKKRKPSFHTLAWIFAFYIQYSITNRYGEISQRSIVKSLLTVGVKVPFGGAIGIYRTALIQMDSLVCTDNTWISRERARCYAPGLRLPLLPPPLNTYISGALIEARPPLADVCEEVEPPAGVWTDADTELYEEFMFGEWPGRVRAA